MNDEEFEELDIFQVSSLLWKAKRIMNPIVIGEDQIIQQITHIECVDADIIINIKAMNANKQPEREA